MRNIVIKVKNVSTFVHSFMTIDMKIIIKKGLYLLGFSAFIGLMASCLGNNNTDDTYAITDAELLSFSLSSDSVPDLVNVAFSIDQPNGLIYNYDSMAYRTAINDKVIITYTSASGYSNLLNITNGDSIWVASGDSIDISAPLTFRVYALDGTTVKIYNAQLNIHQVDPDSLQYVQTGSGFAFLQTEDTKTVALNNRFLAYSRINGQIQLHSSSDAVNWNQEAVLEFPANAVISGIQSNGNQLFVYTEDGDLYVRNDPANDKWTLASKPASIKVKSILGYLPESSKHSKGLCMAVETDGKTVFAFTGDLVQWDYDSNASSLIPDDFPLHDFSNYSYMVMLTGRVTVFGGTSQDGTVQNTVWSTEDGRYWAKLTSSANVFPPLEGANVFYYDNKFWLINGKSGNVFNQSIYYSKDGGVTWWKRLITNDFGDELFPAPDDYSPRYGASAVTDKDNRYIYIIGGKYDSVLPEVWKVFLNKMEFDH